MSKIDEARAEFASAYADGVDEEGLRLHDRAMQVLREEGISPDSVSYPKALEVARAERAVVWDDNVVRGVDENEDEEAVRGQPPEYLVRRAFTEAAFNTAMSRLAAAGVDEPTEAQVLAFARTAERELKARYQR